MLGRNKEIPDDDVPDVSSSRYKVEHLPIGVSGKGMLQRELDKGVAKGWSLRWIESTEQHGWIIVVWDTAIPEFAGELPAKAWRDLP